MFDWKAWLKGLTDRTPPTPPRSAHASLDEAAFAEALARLDQAPPEAVADHYGWRFVTECLSFGQGRRELGISLLATEPDLGWILVFDGDGYLRQAALRALETPPTSPARLMAVMLRLNDWVGPVRQEAERTARRLLPETSLQVITQTAPVLLEKSQSWSRGAVEAELIEDLLARPDVRLAMTDWFLTGRSGPLGSTLIRALRKPTFDADLNRLASDARSAAVRSIALRTLISGEARWPIGYGQEWVDKSLGRSRRVRKFDARPVPETDPLPLLRHGLKDRSASVRRVAADGLIQHANQMPDAADWAVLLLQDRSPSLRERGDYLSRHLPAASSSP